MTEADVDSPTSSGGVGMSDRVAARSRGVPPYSLVFSNKNDAGFREFQKQVGKLLPGAMSVRGYQSEDENGRYFQIEEVRDSRNKKMWSYAEDGEGEVNDLIQSWTRRIYKHHDHSYRKL